MRNYYIHSINYNPYIIRGGPDERLIDETNSLVSGGIRRQQKVFCDFDILVFFLFLF